MSGNAMTSTASMSGNAMTSAAGGRIRPMATMRRRRSCIPRRHRQASISSSTFPKPTISLGVTSAVVSSCGHNSGQIEHRVAHALAGHWATPEGPAACPQPRHPPHAQPLAPGRQPQGRRPRLTPRGCTAQTPPSAAGQPWGRLREAQRHHRSLVPREARPTRRSSFRLLAMASPYWMIYVSY